MSQSLFRDPKLLVRSNGRESAQTSGTTSYPADTAAWTLADSTAGQFHQDAPVQDPFSYYKAFLDSDVPSTGRASINPPHNDGSAGDTVGPAGQLVQGVGEQHCRPRAVPYQLAVRFANRSNGAPLATIIEQRSVSTLNSRGSLLSVGRFPSIRATENVSPGRASYRTSRSLDEKALKGIKEEACQDNDIQMTSKALDVRLQQGCGETERLHKITAPAHTVSHKPEQAGAPQPHDIALLSNGKGLKDFLRGALHHVRGGSRIRSGSSSMTNAAPSNSRGERLDPSDISPQSEHQGEKHRNTSLGMHELPVSAVTRELHPDVSSSHQDAIKTRTRNRKSSSISSEASAGVHPPLLHLPPPTSQLELESDFNPHLLPVSNLSRQRNGTEPLSSVRPAPPGPRDGTQGHAQAGATTLCPRSRDELSARYTLDGVCIPRGDASSLQECDRARDTSRNASFCSTMSTSYSGTVLGVDLDLQHEFPNPARRSVTPVWFTPKDGIDHSVESVKRLQGEGKQPPPRSITSSALSALLPIAAAEGIVRTSSKTPQISFYSPSGNLIQAESTSPPSADTSCSSSSFQGTPTTPTSFYDNTQVSAAYDALAAAVGLPPVRPAAVPMTTPPQSCAPLPEHLRHHHNYQHPERSQITTQLTDRSIATINPGPKVKGCGGVIRPNSLLPRSGIPGSPTPAKPGASYRRSMSCFFNSEANRPRFHPLSSRPKSRKGRTLKKRPPHQRSESGIGRAAGQAMRVCFCQPYDGAGQRTVVPGCGGGGQCHDEASTRRTRDTETPNVRIVTGEDGNEERDVAPTVPRRSSSESGGSAATDTRVCVFDTN
ncbi:hypothetical protein K458DRAFT_423250 [Lentithecium fluviatile CBS 122367]|uniref:Uncharacterized protein n=1 Tax=Lentithecium fluviatile CBS 122367 TaxID=1168545 RepID=A0A6G1IJ87_9PLEO|nr:hypothetical protein K458DRAFT_423250 [Lentithecium fluviatile CBS 122367]